MGKVRFGPAGVPIQCDGSSTLSGVKCCAALQLDAMELEFVQGVRLGKVDAGIIGNEAKKLDISLSSHAPYFINFCSKEEIKIETSKRNLMQAAEITAAAGGRITVFHPGFYQKQTPAEAYASAKKHLTGLSDWAKDNGIRTLFGAETVGKKTAFGGFEEALQLAQDIEQVVPVLDIAHLHARGDFNIRSEEDYQKIFTVVEKALPGYMSSFHFHFSEIEYSDKGERNHLPLGACNVPPFKPLLKVLVENGYGGTIICETPRLDLDAQEMKQQYLREVKSHGR